MTRSPGPGGVYVPVDSCKLTGAGVPADDLYPTGDTVITVRGNCSVPPEAMGLVVNLKVWRPSEAGRMSLFPADGGVFGPGFVNFTPGITANNVAVVELCSGACGSGDLVVRMVKISTPQRVVFHTMGYFAPEGDADAANELNTAVSLVGTELQVTDGGGTLGAELGGFATDAELASHAGNLANPHAVSLEQLTPTSAKGDLLVEDGADVVRLPAGLEGQVLVVDPAEPTGLKWVDVGGGPAVLGPAPVPRTGQTVSYGDRDDGELEAGVPWPDPRFTVNLDGTVTDNLTGLIWLANADCFGERNWEDALAAANGLADGQCGLSDGSVEQDWRLPNVKELQSLIDYGRYDPPLPSPHPFSGVQLAFYWASTTRVSDDPSAWVVRMVEGISTFYPTGAKWYIWPVRGGQ